MKNITGQCYLYLVAATGALIGLATGLTLTWSSPITEKLKHYNKDDYPFDNEISEDEIAWINSAMTLGAILGPLIFLKLPDILGRKITILLLGVPYVLGYTMLVFSHQVYLYIIARVLIGFVASGFFAVLPVYNNEIAHASNRGLVHGILMLITVSGGLGSYSIGPFVPIVVFNAIILAVSALFVPVFWLVAPESPYYLVSKAKLAEATTCLEKLRGYEGPEITKELEEIKRNVSKTVDTNPGIVDFFKNSITRKTFCITASLLVLQQLSGQLVLMSYSQTIFAEAGTSIPAKYCPIILGLIQVIFSLVTPLFADRIGRKVLLIISGAGLALFLGLLGVYSYLNKSSNINMDVVAFLPLVCLIVSTIFQVIGQGPICPLVVAELYPMNVKPLGVSLSTTIQWVISYLMTQFFMKAVDKIGLGICMWIFAGFDVVFALFVYFCVIETKGKSMQEIQDILSG